MASHSLPSFFCQIGSLTCFSLFLLTSSLLAVPPTHSSSSEVKKKKKKLYVMLGRERRIESCSFVAKTCSEQQKCCLKSPVGPTPRWRRLWNWRCRRAVRARPSEKSLLIAVKAVTITPVSTLPHQMNWAEGSDDIQKWPAGLLLRRSQISAAIQRLRRESVFAELPRRPITSDPGRVFAPLLQLAAQREAHFLPLFYFVLSPASGDNFHFISRLRWPHLSTAARDFSWIPSLFLTPLKNLSCRCCLDDRDFSVQNPWLCLCVVCLCVRSDTAAWYYFSVCGSHCDGDTVDAAPQRIHTVPPPHPTLSQLTVKSLLYSALTLFLVLTACLYYDYFVNIFITTPDEATTEKWYWK